MLFRMCRSWVRDGVEPKTRRPRAARSRGLLLFLGFFCDGGFGVVAWGFVDDGVGDGDGDGEEGRRRSGVVGPKWATILR